jgi:translation initiation factor IF-2
MAKVRVSDLAKQMGKSEKDLIFMLQSLGVEVDSPASQIDHTTIAAILTGKKLVARPRNVIMRDETAEPEAPKRKVVKPPRPIVQPPRRPVVPKPKEEEEQPSPTGPVIQEFVDVAEAEAAEPSKTVVEVPKRKVVKPPRPIVKPKTEEPEAEPEVAPAPEPVAAEVPPAAEKKERKPAAAAAKEDPKDLRGATGPRARRAAAPRPDYSSQQPRPVPPRPGARPAAPAQAGQAARGPRAAAAPAGRPTRSAGPVAPAAPVPDVSGAPGRRRRGPGAVEEERPEKKKATGKRRRTTRDEDSRLFTKGPVSATAVLDLDDTPVVRSPSSRRDHRKQQSPTVERSLEFVKPEGKLTVSEGVTVKDLADKIGVRASDLMKHLMMRKGLMLAINSPLGAELAQEVAAELGVELELVSFEQAIELETLERAASTDTAAGPRAPVITVMGHVDHGKTSLLDAIRSTNVAEGEAGGITQHIGAYHVEQRGQKIVFLDTPGHEAFTMMRARGAKVTDIVVLVVAADDGVMPQTKEAISHSRAAGVPMIVAINKIDKPEANVDKVKRELSEAGVLVEDWGGDVVSVNVSAKKKEGIDDLLEMILLTAEMLTLKATPESPARGVVLEARKETGRGIVANVLIQDGTLRISDHFLSGMASGRVRAMMDDRGARIDVAGPATPVSVTGFDEVPNAGDTFIAVDEVSQARAIGELRQARAREESLRRAPKMSLDQIFSKMQEGELKELPLIIKADVQGSVEVLNDSLAKLSNQQVRISTLHSSVGAITTNDVLLASASNAIVIGFNVRPQRDATELAEKEGVDIRTHTVIYELLDEIKLAMTGLLEPTLKEVFQGRAQVRETFKVPKIGTIAGCYVNEGTIPRSAQVRLLRDDVVIHEGKIGSLRHFKNDVSEVKQGFECGIGLERFHDVKVGDVIEAFKVEKLAGVLQLK